MTTNTNKKMKQIVGAVERTREGVKKSYWSRIGVAFENSDGSWKSWHRISMHRNPNTGSRRATRAITPKR